MIAIFYSFAVLVAIVASACALIGYRWKEERWVSSLGEYLVNFATCLLHIAGAAAFIWVYIQVFGVPEVVE